MAEQNGEKSQDATPHRRQQAREEGQVAQSQDLAAAAVLLAGMIALLTLGAPLAAILGRLARQQLGGDAWLSADPEFVAVQWVQVVSGLAWGILPVLGTILVVAVVSHLLQVGFIFVPEKAMPDWNRVNPLQGFGRLFSLPNLVRLGFGIVKIIIVAIVAFWILYKQRTDVITASGLDLPQIALFLSTTLLWAALKIAFALFVLALLDYFFQRWKYEQDLKMTPQEVREEMRNLQGDPQVIARRRMVQRQLVLNRLAKTVPKADVVITNPTELAIAIEYDSETMSAPVVVAKGAGVIAQRIRRLALENDVPIIEKKPLAQALYRDVELNHPIPDTMYAAVAEVLAYVYQLKGKPLPKAAEIR